MKSLSKLLLFPLLLLFLSSSCSTSYATVPASAQFKYVNEGELGPYIVEYDGSYRVLDIGTSPFQLFFYNTTPNAYTLALRMATPRSESLRRWVWEANRGKPVRDNATFSFGSDGNLVLADADGTIAWQSNTANKGVVGFELLSNGNMVLYDSKKNFIWQSFDSPTDTLLVGQSLKSNGVAKLVSRASAQDNSNGPYSFVLEPKALSLYYTSRNSPKPMLYYRSTIPSGPLTQVTLAAAPEYDQVYAYEVTLSTKVGNSSGGDIFLTRPKYNATLSFLRLGIDGNLRVYTFYDPVTWGAWEITFSLFSMDSSQQDVSKASLEDDGCQLPSKCGNFGLCEDNQCVACPLANGLLGWSKDCAPAKLTSCNPTDFIYYKLVGVDHFISKYTKGDNVKESVCSANCSKDCKCMGYFYNQATSRCWIAYDLKTLKKVSDSTHVGYIKAPKK